MYVRSQDMVANLGIWWVTNLKLVDQNSTWINRFDWMKEDKVKFPVKSINKIKLSNTEMTEFQVKQKYI